MYVRDSFHVFVQEKVCSYNYETNLDAAVISSTSSASDKPQERKVLPGCRADQFYKLSR
jgi:hypothetical protein